METVATVYLKLTPGGGPHDDLVNGMSSFKLLKSNSTSSSLTSSGPLLAPFPVPNTDITLLVGARGEDLSLIAVVLGLDELI